MGDKIVLVGHLVDGAHGLEIYNMETQESKPLNYAIRQELMFGKELPIVDEKGNVTKYEVTGVEYSPSKKYKITVEEL